MQHYDQPFPWPPGSATGVGSMPGADPVEALRIVFGELPDLPHLTELPARGPGADLTGRTAALLVDMPVEITPTGWRVAAKVGRDLRRARDYLAYDLDALEAVGEGSAAASGNGGPFKIQICGPWTLAATIELAASQQPALADPGAVRDLIASLAEGIAGHAAEVAKRLPGARLLLQLDEPALPAVLAGAVPTASGLGRLPPVDEPVAQEALRGVFDAVAQPFGIVHCCAPSPPLRLIGRAGARAVSFDLRLLRRSDEDALAEAAEAGIGLLAGVVPAAPPPGGPGDRQGTLAESERLRGGDAAARDGAGAADVTPEAADAAAGGPAGADGAGAGDRAVVAQVAGLWRRLGLPPAWCAERVVLTPACGLAGASPAYARAALARCVRAARALREELEG